MSSVTVFTNEYWTVSLLLTLRDWYKDIASMLWCQKTAGAWSLNAGITYFSAWSTTIITNRCSCVVTSHAISAWRHKCFCKAEGAWGVGMVLGSINTYRNLNLPSDNATSLGNKLLFLLEGFVYFLLFSRIYRFTIRGKVC